MAYAYRGLARRVLLHAGELADLPPAPFGWRYVREEGRNAVLLLPLWLYPLWASRCWKWWVFGPLSSIGFWSLKEEGGYWLEGSWCWRWWRGEERVLDSIQRHGGLSAEMRTQWERRNWWLRLGWWIERATAHVNMPPRFADL